MRDPASSPPPARPAPYATYEAFGLALQVLLAPAMTYVYLRVLELGGWSVGPIVVSIATALRGRGALRRASWYHCAWGGTLLCVALLFGVLNPMMGIVLVAYAQPYVYLLLYAFLAILALVAPSLDRDEARAAARRTAARRARSASSAPPGA